MTMACPQCGSDRVRRGGTRVWLVYVLLLVLGVPAVLVLHLHAGLVGGVMLAAVVIAHLVFHERVCLDCSHQWRLPER
jgi:hypothetical protein